MRIFLTLLDILFLVESLTRKETIIALNITICPFSLIIVSTMHKYLSNF